jgi:hypothetical protein
VRGFSAVVKGFIGSLSSSGLLKMQRQLKNAGETACATTANQYLQITVGQAFSLPMPFPAPH